MTALKRSIGATTESAIHSTEELDRWVSFWVVNIYQKKSEPLVYYYRSLKSALEFVLYAEFTFHPSDLDMVLHRFNKAIDKVHVGKYGLTLPNGRMQWAITPGRLEDQ